MVSRRIRGAAGIAFAITWCGAAVLASCGAQRRPAQGSGGDPHDLLRPFTLSDAAASSVVTESNDAPRKERDADAATGAATGPGGGDAAYAAPLDAPTAAACPPEMILVEGEYCPRVEQICKAWLDDGAFAYYRCAEYAQPSKCLSDARVMLRFCIDREEYVRPGESLPVNEQSYTMSNDICHARGGRNCLEREWQFACEGEAMHPYPYGSGFVRDAKACNIDRSPVASGAHLLDLRAPPADYPQCTSPFGVHNMSGNVEEWATKDDPPEAPPMRASMKGAWWLPGKNTCRAATVDHDEIYRGAQTGVRCCRDAA